MDEKSELQEDKEKAIVADRTRDQESLNGNKDNEPINAGGL
jgi:hypothetical protein